MKAGWDVRPLGEVCDVLDSRRKPITKRDRQPGPYPYFGATGELDRVAGYIFDEPLVLLGEDGAKWGAGERSAFRVSGKVWVNNHAHVIRPIRPRLDDDWLVYYLNFSDLSEFITGLTVPKLNQARMREIPIPLPPLDEQKRIVAVLDEAFEGLSRARANAEASLADARELFDSALAEKLTASYTKWKRRPVAASFVKTRVPAKIQRKEYLDVGLYPIISQEADFINGYWDNDADLVHVARPVVVFGDHTRHIKFVDFDFVVGADGTQIMEPISEIDPKFYYFALRNIPLEGKGYARHFSHLKKEEIEYPADMGSQRQIAEQLAEIEGQVQRLEDSYKSEIEKLDTLRQSLLQKAFSGELT